MDSFCQLTWLEKEFKLHRQTILIDRERSRLPAAQIVVERQKEAVARKPLAEKLLAAWTEAQKVADMALQNYQNEMLRISYLFRGEEPAFEVDAKKKAEEERKVFIMPCPATGCRGFLSTAYKCGVCDIYACPDCHELKGVVKDCDHTCNPDTVASVKAMKKECRNCPECGTSIFKVVGCFAVNTPILLWNGGVKMSQDIVIGDELVGDDGNKRTVLSLVDGEDALYEVKQTNGETYIVNSKHTLVLKYSGDKSLYWDDKLMHWKVQWFDRELRTTRRKNFSVSEYSSKEDAMKYAEIFISSLKFPEEIEMTIDQYNSLDKWSKKGMMGFKSSAGKEYQRTSIEVSFKENGKYYGWSVDGNKRFLHKDFTVLRNCDQMFCTQCHTPFDWKTGKKITNGAIHNPHYFDYIRQLDNGHMPRQPGDIPCGEGLPTAWRFDSVVRRVAIDEKVRTPIWTALNTFTHIRHVEIPRNTNHAEDTDNTQVNVRYLKKEITEKQWKQFLQTREKRRMRRDEMRQRMEAICGAASDVYGMYMQKTARFVDRTRTSQITFDESKELVKSTQELFGQVKKLREIFNAEMHSLSYRYRVQMPMINEDFRWDKQKASRKKGSAGSEDSDDEDE
jgi:hypothetical protein